MTNGIVRFLIISLIFGVIAWLAKRLIPEAVIAALVVIAIIVLWLVKAFLPFVATL